MSLALRTPHEGVDTSRFILRPLAMGDETLYSDIYCDPETMRHVGPHLSTEQAARSFRAALRQTADPQAKVRFLVAVEKATGIALGICGATLGVPRLASAEIGIMLRGTARGQGFSHEVLAQPF